MHRVAKIVPRGIGWIGNCSRLELFGKKGQYGGLGLPKYPIITVTQYRLATHILYRAHDLVPILTTLYQYPCSPFPRSSTRTIMTCMVPLTIPLTHGLALALVQLLSTLEKKKENLVCHWQR